MLQNSHVDGITSFNALLHHLLRLSV